MSPATTVSRAAVLRYRWARQRDAALLDFGVQDTGPDGAPWALALRGIDAAPDDLAYAWTLRGAPHAYRRADIGAVAVATSPFSDADAAKRIFDASKPLQAAGLTILDALRTVVETMRSIVAEPTVKGEVSRRLTDALDGPFLRECRPCQAIHAYEQPFRLAALQAGLVLRPGTSPPVLERVPRLRPLLFGRQGTEADPRFDVVRNHLRFYGPARVKDTAVFLDAAHKDVQARWPDDAVEVRVRGDDGPARHLLGDDLDALGHAPRGELRLLGPFDPYLQLRDRELLVPDPARRKELWPVIGRPGAIVADGEIIATWRPRTSGSKLTIRLTPWKAMSRQVRADVAGRAEELAAHRGVALAGVVEEG